MGNTFEHHQLKNGLTVAAEINPDSNTAAAGFFVKVGSRDEPEALMGCSHFLEHMIFKGTDRRTADDVNREFDELGANYNAFTTQEATAFWAQVLPEFLPQVTDLLTDIMRPTLRDDDFNMEKNVILEEISMYDDQPGWLLLDVALESYFRGHPLGHRVLGTTETVSGMTAEQMRDYFKTWYHPGNIVVAGAGNIDFDCWVKQLEQLTAHWQPSDAARTYQQPAPQQVDQTIRSPKVHRHYVAMLIPAPSYKDDLREPARIVADMVGSEEGSRLYWALVDPGIADEADLSYFPMDGTGAFFAFAACEPDRAERVETILRNTLADVAGRTRPEEILRAQNKLATGLMLSNESPRGRMNTLGEVWTYANMYMSLDDELGRVMDVSREDVEAVVSQHPLEPVTTIRLTPGQA